MTPEEMKSLQNIVNKSQNQNEAQQEMSGADKANAIMEVAKKPEDMLNVKLSENIVAKVNTDEKVKKKIDETSEKVIDKGLKTQENKVDTQESESDFELKKEVYSHFGINSKVNKKWKRRIYEGFVDFWDVVIGIATGFTIVPISIVLDRFSNIGNKLVRAVAIGAGILSLVGLLFLMYKGGAKIVTEFLT